jgi:hypothetical protein
MKETIYYCKTCEDMVTATAPVECKKCSNPRVVTGTFEKKEDTSVEPTPRTP